MRPAGRGRRRWSRHHGPHATGATGNRLRRRLRSRPMRWTAVVNPAAGRGRTRRLVPELTRARPHGPRRRPARRLGRRRRPAAARRRSRTGSGVVVCGGDGTVYELAALAADCDGALAMVPTGSGNDFARHFGIDGGDAPTRSRRRARHRDPLRPRTRADGRPPAASRPSPTPGSTPRRTGGRTPSLGPAATRCTSSRCCARSPSTGPDRARDHLAGRPRAGRAAWLVAVGNTRTTWAG